MDKEKTKHEKDMYVVKHNDLIQARYNLTAQQQKIILYAISKIKPNDKPGAWYEISIEDLCNACGLIIDDTGYYYKSIKDDLRNLTKRLWIKLPNHTEITVSWIADAEIVPLSGKVYIKFHEKLEPYLFTLTEHYTQYKLKNVLIFKNKYSIRLYELLKMKIKESELNMNEEDTAKFTISELKEILGVDGYPRWAEFKRNVIDRAIEEINKFNIDYHIEYETFKKGKNIEYISFIVTYATAQQSHLAYESIKEREKGRTKRKHTTKTKQKEMKLHELSKRRAEIETKLSNNPSFEVVQESSRELLEITKEFLEGN